MSRYPMTLLVGASLVATTFGCAASQPAAMSEEDVAAINQAREMEVEGIESGNAEAALASYTADVVFMAPNEPAMMGADAARSWFEAATEQFDLNVNYTSSDIQVAGDWAVERWAATATYTPKDGGDALVEQIKGLHVYRRQADGTWKISQDVWNTDAPPPAM